MVEPPTIDRVKADVANCSDEALERAFDRFFSEQTEVCDFVMDITGASRQKVRELALYLSYVVYRSLDEEDGAFTRDVTGERIAAACRESRAWIERLGETDESDLEARDALGREPHLLKFIIGEVHDAAEGGLDLSEEEKGTVFFTLRTVIQVLAKDAGTG